MPTGLGSLRCPYRFIYSTGVYRQATIEEKVTYLGRHVVEKLEPEGDGVTILAARDHREKTSPSGQRRGSRGGGAASTAWLTHRRSDDQDAEMPDSQYFIYPFFSFGTLKVDAEELHHAYVQAFIETDDPGSAAVPSGNLQLRDFET